MRGFQQTNSFLTVGLMYILFTLGLATFRPNGLVFEWDIPAAPPSRSIDQEYPDLREFVEAVRDGKADQIQGVYVPEVFALPVIQQPKNNAIYVSNKRGRLTQFRKAAENGVTGLLAHNYLSGELFYRLTPRQELMVVFGDGTLQRYQVTKIWQYQKLEATRLRSDFVDLSSGQKFTSGQIFDHFYRGEHRLIFQTCLEANGILDWGLTFVVAVPVDKPIKDLTSPTGGSAAGG